MVGQWVSGHLKVDPCRQCRSQPQLRSSGEGKNGGKRPGRGGNINSAKLEQCEQMLLFTTAHTRLVMPAARGARSLGAFSISFQTVSRIPSFIDSCGGWRVKIAGGSVRYEIAHS
jgi:hypothetical protein